MTERVFFCLELPAASIDEYQSRHDDLWPELREAIRSQGGHNYSIFALPEVNRVVGYVEVDSLALWDTGAKSELTLEWWKHMADIMPTNADSSPIQHPIIEVFHQK